jgi:uncharacterized lipoprotein YmbA
LQEGLGQLERAAEARAGAERARESHRLAGVELAEYLARIKAIEDSRPSRRGKEQAESAGEARRPR